MTGGLRTVGPFTTYWRRSRMTNEVISLAHAPEMESFLRRARQHVLDDGYVYIKDVPDEFDHVSFIENFGRVTPQYDGKPVWDLQPEPGMDDVYHSRNTQPLVPHTELYEYPGTPPRYLALWCIRPAVGEGGETTLADGYAFLESFAPDELEELERRQYKFVSSEGLRRQGMGTSADHPMLERRADGRPIIRFSYNNMVDADGDQLQARFREGMNRFFADHHFGVSIERNGLLLWDNHRMIHSRTGFADRRRHLRRALLAEHESDLTP